MKLTKTIKIFIFFFILLNLLISFSAIWFLTRENYDANIRVKESINILAACHNMLENLEDADYKDENRYEEFFNSLKILNKNISSKKEKKISNIIIRDYKKALLKNDIFAKNQIRLQLQKLAKINRYKILQFKNTLLNTNKDGAWAIVFLQSFVFLITIVIFIRFKKEVLAPLEEIYDVVGSVGKQDEHRRCSSLRANHDLKVIQDGINNLLDEKLNYDRNQY